ncbi:FtsX-like permease family protein [Clostridium mediterraneense]|uniref:FtsX-like permease family protein n=1 Tax=Clostridium mediterraneense TaxID=1805472 RepID=UPI0008327B00|nr:FtsX-like permease family protein [Clostridium mediterraneense]
MGITGFITKILKRDYKQTSYLIISLTISYIIVFNIFNICTIDIMQANNIQENIVLGMIILSVTAVSMFLGCYLNQVFLERRRSEMAMQMVCGVSVGQVLGGVLFQTLIISGISIILGFGIGFLISPIFNNLVYSMLGVAGSPYFISIKGLVVSLVIIFM